MANRNRQYHYPEIRHRVCRDLFHHAADLVLYRCRQISEHGLLDSTSFTALVSTTKSCLTSSDAEVIKLGEKDFNIEGNIQGLTNDKVQVSYSRVENKKTYILNAKKISKFSNRAKSLINFNFNSPVGPFLCLPTIISAIPSVDSPSEN